MSQNKFVPEKRQSLDPSERRSSISPLPTRADSGMSRRQQQWVFEQVKRQVLDVANYHFDHTARIIKRWLTDDESHAKK